MPAALGPRIAIELLALLSLAGCGLNGPCDHQRGIVLYGRVNGGDVKQADQNEPLSMVALWEHQRDGFSRQVIWAVYAPRLRGSPTGVGLYQGGASVGGGTLLYAFPIENLLRDLQRQGLGGTFDQITAGSAEGVGEGTPGPWYGGTLPFEELMQRMYRAQTYVEIQTDSVPAGEFRAPLGTPLFMIPPDDPAEWRPVYCS